MKIMSSVSKILLPCRHAISTAVIVIPIFIRVIVIEEALALSDTLLTTLNTKFQELPLHVYAI